MKLFILILCDINLKFLYFINFKTFELSPCVFNISAFWSETLFILGLILFFFIKKIIFFKFIGLFEQILNISKSFKLYQNISKIYQTISKYIKIYKHI